jgi:hypothetical protein
MPAAVGRVVRARSAALRLAGDVLDPRLWDVGAGETLTVFGFDTKSTMSIPRFLVGERNGNPFASTNALFRLFHGWWNLAQNCDRKFTGFDCPTSRYKILMNRYFYAMENDYPDGVKCPRIAGIEREAAGLALGSRRRRSSKASRRSKSRTRRRSKSRARRKAHTRRRK